MNIFNAPNNEQVPMTRRFPDRPKRVLLRDSKICQKIIQAWDVEQSESKVLDIFLKEKKNLSDERYWELLRTVWVVAGSTENSDQFRELMQSKRKQRFYFSTPEDAKALREMPETFEVYRATNSLDCTGIAYTIYREYAEWYQNRYGKAVIIERTVKRSEVFALINRNKEFEAIILQPNQSPLC